MICAHRSIKQPHTGQTDRCPLCQLDIIFDGKRWVWIFGIDNTKRQKLIRAFDIDRITGAHQ